MAPTFNSAISMLTIEELELKLQKLREEYKNGDSHAKTAAHFKAIPLKILLNKKQREQPQIPLVNISRY